jgi:hypothetical protein
LQYKVNYFKYRYKDEVFDTDSLVDAA